MHPVCDGSSIRILPRGGAPPKHPTRKLGRHPRTTQRSKRVCWQQLGSTKDRKGTAVKVSKDWPSGPMAHLDPLLLASSCRMVDDSSTNNNINTTTSPDRHHDRCCSLRWDHFNMCVLIIGALFHIPCHFENQGGRSLNVVIVDG